MAVALGIAALIVALVSAGAAVRSIRHARRSAVAADEAAKAAKRSAEMAEAADRRARTPHLTILLDQPGQGDRMIYRIRNDGPQDLDDMVVHHPQPPDGIKYEITRTGDMRGWQDRAELGPIAMTQEGRITLSCGAAEELPEFRVRVVSHCGTDTWETVYVLPSPRGSASSAAVSV
jgi:hypothetical protein